MNLTENGFGEDSIALRFFWFVQALTGQYLEGLRGQSTYACDLTILEDGGRPAWGWPRAHLACYCVWAHQSYHIQ
jgi:hypothetical protein